MAVHVGSVLAGRYEITAPIASGGMGEVWQARDRTLGRIVAAKVLRSEYTSDPSFLIRFRNEARHTAALSHPNIASVYDYGESTQDGQRVAYLVMEYVEGKPLVTVLAEQGRLSPELTLDVVGQAGDGLSAAHAAGMVHRDIKPGNLIVRPDGVVKLTDFGIARARDAAPLTRTGMVVGTAQYLSPEQAQGFPVTAASDVYSLGVLAYECLAGSRPFDGESQVAIALAQINRPPPPLPPDVPPAVRALVERALAKDPAERFADGAAVAAAVRVVARGGSLPPRTARTQMVAGAGDSTTVLPALGGPTRARTGPQTAPRTMPPLAGPPVGGRGDDVYDDLGLEDDEPPNRRRRLLWLVAGLALLLLVGGGVAVLLSGKGGNPGGGASTTATSSAAPTTSAASTSAVDGEVYVDTSAYVGEPADDVAATLQDQGLVVDRETATQAQMAATGRQLGEETVADTDPAETTLAKGGTVVLYVAENGWAPDDGTDDSNGGGGAATTTRAPATTTRPTAPSTTTAPPTTTPPTTTTEPPPTTTEPPPTTTEPPPT
ncbi:MAG TPA: serine/threonine protein kinase [Modestobacter sp.]|nr:serine/threonine protein kinase [Modestobacter sp.]